MPASRNPHTYPSEFFDLAEAATCQDLNISIQIASEKDARALQRRWYYWRAALRATTNKAFDRHLLGAERINVTCIPSGEVWQVRFSTVSASVPALRAAINAALDAVKQTTPPPDAPSTAQEALLHGLFAKVQEAQEVQNKSKE